MKELQLSLYIPCPEHILWWMICIGLIGSMITGVMMLQAGRFTLTRDGMVISTQKFHLIGSAAKAGSILGNMNRNARTSMRRGIRIDFWYTPFFYGLMICLSVLALWQEEPGTGWNHMLQILCWVPAASWAFDLMEDAAAISVLNSFEEKREVPRSTAVFMTAASLLKWITGIAWLTVIISWSVASAVGA